MGRKSSAKAQPASPPPTPPVGPPARAGHPFLIGVVAVAAVAIAVLAFRPGSESAAPDAPTASTGMPPADRPAPTPAKERAAASEEAVRRAEELAKFGPRRQQALPPVPFQAYAPPRSPEVITAAYRFAAEHPEILSYVPCFCGCENSGHDGNHDCFVKERAPNGDVIAWDEHGVECAVCIDVANRSRQMHASGASVRDIRAAIEREFGLRAPTQTPTPAPPAHGH
jgi:hypothetical protein